MATHASNADNAHYVRQAMSSVPSLHVWRATVSTPRGGTPPLLVSAQSLRGTSVSNLLRIDRSNLRWKLSLIVLAGIVVAGTLELWLPVPVLQSALAAALIVVLGGHMPIRRRLAAMAIVTVLGGAMGMVAYIAAEQAVSAAIVLGLIAYLTGLTYGISRSAGAAGYVLLWWSVVVMIGQARNEYPAASSIAFLVGGLVAMAVVAVVSSTRHRRALHHRGPERDSGEAPRLSEALSVRSLVKIARSPLGLWILVRAVLAGIAVFVGYALTNTLDPYWAAAILLVVFLPDLTGTVKKAAQRGLGTVVGVVTATALTTNATSETPVIIVAIVGILGAVTFYYANYLIYAFFVTNAVLCYYWLAVDHEMSGPAVRLVDTLVAIALSIAGVAFVDYVSRRRGWTSPA